MDAKENIKLRERLLASGNSSLYLDIYRNGRREYEFLKLYLIPEKSRADRDKNRQTLQLAEAIRAKRLVELVNGEYGFKNRNTCIRFFDYLGKVAEQHTVAKTVRVWECAIKHLRKYESDTSIKIAAITKKWIEGFVDYLDKAGVQRRNGESADIKLSEGTKSLYLAKLNAVLIQAVKDGILTKNPMTGIKLYNRRESERMFLTVDELRRLANTTCKHSILRRAFIFSCLTGLRWSDINLLEWHAVQTVGKRTRIVFTQKKTGRLEYLDISEQASALLEERKDGAKVFDGLSGLTVENNRLKKWVAAAGIDKHISFHCARHTFAVMMLELGTDIYTVSKLLGHRNLTTTQVYAKVLDKTKQEAVERIPKII